MGITMKQVSDTSKTYDDLVGFKAKENVKINLATFLGDETDDKPEVKPKKVDPEYPDDWQNLFVNFTSEEQYRKFMLLIGEVPAMNLKVVKFSKTKDNGIMNFFE